MCNGSWSFPTCGQESERARLRIRYTDHLNTPRLVADATGTTVWRWDQQEPFGDSPANEDPDGNSVAFDLPLRLPGQYYDAESGLHYNYFRDYDPTLGIYKQSDPIGLEGGINTYAYGGGNPVSLSDRLGLLVWNCKYHSRTFIEVFGAGTTSYTCTSPCVKRMQATIKVVFVGPGAGIGIPNLPAGESYGDVSFDDHVDDITPSRFSGFAMTVGAGASIGELGLGANKTRLGRAFSTGTGNHQTGGIAVGAELVVGSSTVTDVKLEPCSECPAK